MRSSLNVAFFALVASTHALPEHLGRALPSVCNADNCLRAVIVTGTEDCSSFLSKTVTPCTSTVTTTVTVDVTSKPDAAIIPATPTAQPTTQSLQAKRADATASPAPTTCVNTTDSPSAVPSTASACSGTSRYSSTCSCAGVTGQTTTLPQVTTTVTFSSTSTYPASATCTNFILQVVGTDGANPYLKRAIADPEDSDLNSHMVFDACGPEDAQVWRLGQYENHTDVVQVNKPYSGWFVSPLCISPNYFVYTGVGDGPPPCDEDDDVICGVTGDDASPTYTAGTLGCTIAGLTQTFQTFCGYLQGQGLQNILQRADADTPAYYAGRCNNIVIRALPLCNRDHYR